MSTSTKTKFLEIVTPWAAHHRLMIADPNGFGIVQVEIPTDCKEICYIWCLYVYPGHRNEGLASALLQRAEEYGKSQGCFKAVLDWAEIDSPLWVYKWYERQGYREVEFGKHNARLEKLLTQ